MTASVSLVLDQNNLQTFAQALRDAAGGLRDERDQLDVARQAEQRFEQMQAGNTPDFVQSRLKLIPSMSAMLRDVRWHAPQSLKLEFAGALAYFTDECDLIPDASPQFGLLDDALVIELALRHHLDEWREWQRFDAVRLARRDVADLLTREDWISLSERQRAGLIQRNSWKRFARDASDGSAAFKVH